MMEERVTGKRQQIIDAAIRIFAKNGFHQAKIENIAQDAAVGKGTVYEYFTSKEELFLEIFKEARIIFHQRIYAELEGAKSSAEKVMTIIRHNLLFLDERRDLATILWHEHFGMNEEICQWVYNLSELKVKVLADVLEEGMDSGEFRNCSTDMTARTIMAAVGSNCGYRIKKGLEIPVEEWTKEIFMLTLQGIQA